MIDENGLPEATIKMRKLVAKYIDEGVLGNNQQQISQNLSKFGSVVSPQSFGNWLSGKYVPSKAMVDSLLKSLEKAKKWAHHMPSPEVYISAVNFVNEMEEIRREHDSKQPNKETKQEK